MPFVTCGDRKDARRGTRVELAKNGCMVESLCTFLARVVESYIWWAPTIWDDDRRIAENWRGAGAIALDIDYHDEAGIHTAIPVELVDEVLRKAKELLPGNILHRTPRGLRLVAVLAEGPISDRSVYQAAARGFARKVEETLQACNLAHAERQAGLKVDWSAVGDLARYFFLANLERSIPGEAAPRRADVIVLNYKPVPVAALVAEDRVHTLRKERNRGRRTDRAFIDAANRWGRAHPEEYPAPGTGTCPMCGHNGCFGQLADDATRWACFSTGHGQVARSRGAQGDKCWIGSSLDLEAHRRGCQPIDVLTSDGYLPTSRSTSRKTASPSPVASLTFEVTDVGNAERFAAEVCGVIRFNSGIGWLAWDGIRWTSGQEGESMVHERAKQLVKALHHEAADAAGTTDHQRLITRAKRAGSRGGFEAMLVLASRSARLLVRAEQLDADHTLLNCPNGVVDLKTGILLPHDPARLMTHVTGVPFDPSAKCPTWLRTLNEIFGGQDQLEIMDYIQRAFGYTLTGLIREEVFFMLWGEGRNGKGTMVDALRKVMGSYATSATMNLFLAQRNDSSKQFEIAGLVGARMVVASEAGAERSFDAAVLKMFTGGDRRSACHKHRPYFEYSPTDKLWFQVNDKPKVPSWDTAFQERCRLIPFENQFTEENGNLDPNRKRDLERELAGILAWAVQGSVRYFNEGLSPPQRVRVAVAEYRSESTRVAEFLDQHFKSVSGSDILQSRIYATYRGWCQSQGMRPVATNRFGQYLHTAGYDTKKERSGMLVLGIAPQQGVSLLNERGQASGHEW